MLSPGLAVYILLLGHTVLSDTTVTIYNQWLSQGGRVHYESDRWNKHNGLDRLNLISHCKSLGTPSGRWLNRDLNDHLFENWSENPSHHGYPNPNYAQDHALQSKIWKTYMGQRNGYGSDIDNLVWEISGTHWPKWMDTSQHQGQFPNNLDAAAEFVSLMVQSAKDYTGGHIPHIFEVINEPNAHWQFLSDQTVVDFHRIVAQKLKSRFGMKVGGPTYSGYSLEMGDMDNFRLWKKAAGFLDMSLDHLDFFSFHAYNDLRVSDGNHRFTGFNEARLVAAIDMIENYSHIKKGKNVPIIISEFGRDRVMGMDQWSPNGLIDFATIYQPNGHMFTYLNLREFIDRAIVFMLSNEQYPGHTSLNWSLFTGNGQETQMTKFFKFWKYLYNNQKFLRVTSEYSGWERLVACLALADPNNKEMSILLHNYGTSTQNVKLDFKNGWINPTSGESTCIQYENGNPAMHSNIHFSTSGKVSLPGESTCLYKFKTSYNFGSVRTNNENTYYGKEMIIPISNGHAETTISVPSSGYNSALLRVGVSRTKNTNGKPLSIMFNGYKLPSTFMLYDADKDEAKTQWQMWEFWVPEGHVRSSNTVAMTFAGNGGHVTSVALVAGKLQ
ncbi:beta-porphyranase A-like [Haliotis rufescens]|uniref:beta-porphyranase A-like n=1 Tax=Haliotis rufescens TaxID=6454 RepID=UPI00201F810A|nr:beta-porphyranase A-like [Haliotis rufescens]